MDEEVVKISELEEADELFEGCCMPVTTMGVTKKVTFQTLKNQIMADIPPVPSVPTKTSDLQNDSNFISSTVVTAFWTGTQAQYDAITTKDEHTLYLITES